MKITDIKITLFEGEGKLKGYASVTLNDELVARGIRIIDGRNGLFASMPARKWKDEYYDIFFPITKEFSKLLQDEVINAYHNTMKKVG